MRAWLAAIIGLGCLAATAGCGGHAKYANLALEEENRQLEDVIYQQQAELERTHQALEACRQAKPVGPPPGAAGVVPPPALVPPVVPRKPGAPDTSRPPVMVEMPSAPTTQVPDTLKETEAPPFLGGQGKPSRLNEAPTLQLPATPENAPRLEMPEPQPSDKRAPQPLRNPSGEAIPAPASENSTQGRRRLPGNGVASAQVAEITLNDAMTGGCQTDPERGDRGIGLLLEPRDGNGRLIAAPASVSVVVLDPAMQGQAARVARWDFSAEQLAPLYRKGSSGEGFHLEMLWPAAPPVHEELHLFVRYVTSDGRRLETQRQIRVAVAGSGSQGLTADRRGSPPVGPNGERTWQQRPSSPTPAAPAEPLRLSSRAASPVPRDAAALPPPRETSPSKPTRPVWSPERR